MQDIRITLVQGRIAWEDIAANLELFDRRMRGIGETDLILLPEMFTTGFSMDAVRNAEDMNGTAVAWMRRRAKEKGADIVGSLIIRESGKYYNRLVWAHADGWIGTYDKRHLFRMSGEHTVFAPGSGSITVPVQGWNIRPFICYDLRFPVWTRNFQNQYDIAVYVANWPAKRSLHWKALLQARAIENQCYVVGVNRVGTDGRGVEYSGDSSIIDPAGNILFQAGGEECVHTESLARRPLEDLRENFPVWKDADDDMVKSGSD